jgi:hypothetical protein
MQIEHLIGDLLMRHNCVVIPNFGGFVAGQTSSKFDPTKGISIPPHKSLLFNKHLITNDGLLIAAYANENKISYEDAHSTIQDQVQIWQRKMSKGDRVTIDRVGFLYLDAERNIGFEQDKFYNLLLSSFGLGKVHFIVKEDISVLQEVEKTNLHIEDREEITKVPIINLFEKEETFTQSSKNKKVIWKYIAAAAILPICFYSLWIPFRTPVLESGLISIQDFNPLHAFKKPTYIPNSIDLNISEYSDSYRLNEMIQSIPKDIAVFSYEYDSETYIPVRLHSVKKLEKVIPKISSKKPSQVTSINAIKGNMHLIVGCFSTEKNAMKLIKELKGKGFDAYIVDVVNGLHRVSAANSNSDSLLKAKNQQLVPLNIEGWILRK